MPRNSGVWAQPSASRAVWRMSPASSRLTGAPLTASDLRGGAAMLVAGLCAEGATELFDDGYIDRGYDRFDACLSALGADVRCAAPR